MSAGPPNGYDILQMAFGLIKIRVIQIFRGQWPVMMAPELLIMLTFITTNNSSIPTKPSKS